MPKRKTFEILLESHGETLDVGDVRLESASFDKSCIEGVCVKSGQRECLSISGPSKSGSAGNLSLFAGAEKIGTLNWDCTDPLGDILADWTPLSKNFTTSVAESNGAGAAVARLILRVTRPLTGRVSSDKMAVATGHLGFAGI